MELFLDFSYVSGIFITSLILFFLFKERKKDFSKKLLTIIFVFILFVFLFFYSYIHKIRSIYLLSFIFQDSINVFIGPLLLLYVKSLFRSNFSIKKETVHFILPFLYILIITIPCLISVYNRAFLFTYLTEIQNYISLSLIYSLVYCFISVRVLFRAKKWIKRTYSNIENRDLKWIENLLFGIILIISIDVFTTFYELIFGEEVWNIGHLTVVPLVFFMGYIGYNGVLQTKILLPEFLLQNSSEIAMNKTSVIVEKKNVKNPYKLEEMNMLKEALLKVMDDEKPYLMEDLTLGNLAELLSTTDKKLSVLLNQFMHTSFYDYINDFRIKHVINMMENPDFNKYTLLAIAFESGFKSKTSFNRIFKKVTQSSPSEYKKNVLAKN